MTADSSSLNGLLSTPLVLPASVAGALAALFVVLAVMALRRAGAAGLRRWLFPVATLVIVALAVTTLLDRMAQNDRAAERRALLQRAAELSASALAPGSMLSCLDGGAGETVGNACEKAVFADAQAAASAVAYTAQRLTLLKDAASVAERDPSLIESFAATRRALELDRYGLVAHVLAERDGCTAERCSAFALLQDTGTLKANLRVRAFETYVARYATAWNKPEPKTPPVAEAQPPAPGPALASAPAQPETAGRAPVPSQIRFPLGRLDPAGQHHECRAAAAEGRRGAFAQGGRSPAAPADAAAVPVPPKRPQAQAPTPPAR